MTKCSTPVSPAGILYLAEPHSWKYQNLLCSCDAKGLQISWRWTLFELMTAIFREEIQVSLHEALLVKQKTCYRYFYSNEKGLKAKFADQWKLSYLEFSIISQIHRQTDSVSLTLAWLQTTKNGKKIETVTRRPYLNMFTLCFYKERSVFWHVPAKHLHNVYRLNFAFNPHQKIISPIFDPHHSIKW